MIALSLFQPFAHFRNPSTWNHPRSYPLPPRSTVIGMLQNLTRDYYDPEWKEAKIAITGNFVTKFQHYSWFYRGKEFAPSYAGLWIRTQENRKWVWKWYNLEKSISPQFVEEILGLYLTIFVESPRFEERILESLKNPPLLYLGRAEDVVYVRAFDKIELEDISYHIPSYYYWEKDEDGLLVPLHSDFFLGDRPVQNRTQLMAYRDKVKREVYWDKVAIREPNEAPHTSVLGGVEFNGRYYVLSEGMLLGVEG